MSNSFNAFERTELISPMLFSRLTWWLPLLLDDQHCARALPLLKSTIAALATDPRRAMATRGAILEMARHFSPLDTLKVGLCKMTSSENCVLRVERAILSLCILFLIH